MIPLTPAMPEKTDSSAERIQEHQRNISQYRENSKDEYEVHGMAAVILNTILDFVPQQYLHEIPRDTPEWDKWVRANDKIKPSKLYVINEFHVSLPNETIRISKLVIARYDNTVVSLNEREGTIFIIKTSAGTRNVMKLIPTRFGVHVDFNDKHLNTATPANMGMHPDLANKLFEFAESFPDDIAQGKAYVQKKREEEKQKENLAIRTKLKGLGVLDF